MHVNDGMQSQVFTPSMPKQPIAVTPSASSMHVNIDRQSQQTPAASMGQSQDIHMQQVDQSSMSNEQMLSQDSLALQSVTDMEPVMSLELWQGANNHMNMSQSGWISIIIQKVLMI